MMMTSAQVRQAFLDFFAARGHTVVPSSSLVPDDPTLLFTNAGMVQFKDAFLGLEQRSYSRATTAQKCMRVSGKHNDLENVGPSPGHHTFFEMLGNFSFGDYFKREAIHYAYDFVVKTLGVDPDRLRYTVYLDDDEAWHAWVYELGVPPDRVYRMGDKTNFWMMGDVGPCGPTSELHFDWGPAACTCGQPDCSVYLDNGCGRWLEIWNLVFMQFDQAVVGTRTRLPKPGVDTGMGLERMVSIVQNTPTNYDTDLFVPIMDRIQQIIRAGTLTPTLSQGEREADVVAYRVVADHGRAMTFLIADGVLPGNEGRSYVLRMIMRRAMRFARKLGFDGSLMPDVAQAVIDHMGGHYHELIERRSFILQAVAQEEERFQRTLDAGLTRLDRLMAELEARGERVVPGDEAFKLYDSFGFPLELARDVAQEHGFGIDAAGFAAAMAGQRERARAAAKFGVADAAEFYRRLELPRTEFLGYDYAQLDGAEARILALVRDGEPVQAAQTGDQVEVVLDRTPFYAEAGGQVGDTGRIVARTSVVEVGDTRAPAPGVIVHYGRVIEGQVLAGQAVTAQVNVARRWDIMRNHTATHLLHRALQHVLGSHAQQRGSLVAPDRLRFDFAHLQPVTPDELATIERQVNAAIRADLPVTWRTMPLDDARRAGAMALFGEKYADVVRVVSIGGDQEIRESGNRLPDFPIPDHRFPGATNLQPSTAFWRELCGGTHLERTGQIGSFYVTAESSIGSGLRRIEAVTGRGAEEWAHTLFGSLNQAARALAVAPGEVGPKVGELLGQLDAQRREIGRLWRELAKAQVERLVGQAQPVGGVPVVAAQVDAPDMDALREMTDWLRDRLGSAVVVLATVVDGRPQIVAAVTPDLVARGLNAGQIVRQVAQVVGGGGGGKPTLAQAGGKDASRLGEALARVPGLIASR
jgi:alanyl-tRNA synthetase